MTHTINMLRSFSLRSYKELLITALENNYYLSNYINFIKNKNRCIKVIILRHDVDKKPMNSLKKAIIENKLNISATYYFRIVKESFNENIVKNIANLGHEIGYHYEDLALAKGNYKIAIKLFTKNLAKLREFYPVKTICMHGSPLSKWNNKLIWNKYDYKNYGILSEPYLDLNFDEIFYLTDTGMKWNASHMSLRDKVNSKYNLSFNSTFDIIQALNFDELPNKIMINTHPQRWSNKFIERITEYLFQTLKNVIKRQIIKKNIMR